MPGLLAGSPDKAGSTLGGNCTLTVWPWITAEKKIPSEISLRAPPLRITCAHPGSCRLGRAPGPPGPGGRAACRGPPEIGPDMSRPCITGPPWNVPPRMMLRVRPEAVRAGPAATPGKDSAGRSPVAKELPQRAASAASARPSPTARLHRIVGSFRITGEEESPADPRGNHESCSRDQDGHQPPARGSHNTPRFTRVLCT